jgi:hypothetical protein
LQRENLKNNSNDVFGIKSNFAFEQIKELELMKNMLGKKRSSPETIPVQL